nr:uncharacterized protein LOC127486089 isoform X2 [Oryctolagus cuniculus]
MNLPPVPTPPQTIISGGDHHNTSSYSVYMGELMSMRGNMSRLHNSIEPRVMDDEMLKLAVSEQGPREEAGQLAKQEGILFKDVLTLQLDFQNILHIDNLWQFENLRKLQLDNNIIERIEGLENLVHLVWLDLSFNNIEVIKGLDSLVNLEDLSLFNNRISRIDSLDALGKLQVLSLGNNQIDNIMNQPTPLPAPYSDATRCTSPVPWRWMLKLLQAGGITQTTSDVLEPQDDLEQGSRAPGSAHMLTHSEGCWTRRQVHLQFGRLSASSASGEVEPFTNPPVWPAACQLSIARSLLRLFSLPANKLRNGISPGDL